MFVCVALCSLFFFARWMPNRERNITKWKSDSHWENKLCESNLTLFDVKATRARQEYRFFCLTIWFYIAWLWWVYSTHDSKYCMNATKSVSLFHLFLPLLVRLFFPLEILLHMQIKYSWRWTNKSLYFLWYTRLLSIQLQIASIFSVFLYLLPKLRYYFERKTQPSTN